MAYKTIVLTVGATTALVNVDDGREAPLSKPFAASRLVQFKEVNNELVVPAYRQFCRDNDLNFHFWDELPKEAFDLKISGREFELHKEAMDLFNRLKPEHNLFRNQFVTFWFTSWAGDFDYTTKDVEGFIRDHSRRQTLNEQQRTIISILEVTIVILLLPISISLIKYLSTNPRWGSYFDSTTAILGAILVCPISISGLHVWLHRRPIKKKRREMEILHERLRELRHKLNEQ